MAVINGSKTGVATGSGWENYAIFQDEKSAGTDGGTFTASAWQTRVLNTTHATAGSGITLASNQITLAKGYKYLIEAKAPARMVDSHKLKFRNITDSTDDIIGPSALARSAGNETGFAFLRGVINLVAAGTNKTFELQHYCNATRATDGFGLAYNLSVTEVYAQIKVVRLT